MRHLRTTLALDALALLVLASCSQNSRSGLESRYPAVAGEILGSDGFERAGDGYAPKAPSGTGTNAATPPRGGLDLRLPVDAGNGAVFTTAGKVQVMVRERGASGSATPVGAALAYPRTGGTSYWTATAAGFEEWIEVEQAGDAPVAEWEVAGASLRQAGDGVEVVDGAGVPLIRVAASRAYLLGGGQARAWLRASGQVLSLFTDARGPALIDPSWATVGNMPDARRYHSATLLFSGKVLVAGGNTTGTTATANTALFDPVSGLWTASGTMTGARYQHTATLLHDGRVLVAGGTNGASTLATAQLYDPATGLWSSAHALNTPRQAHTATLLSDGTVLVVGGTNGTAELSSAELYDPVANTWTFTIGPLATARQKHTATLLPDGKVLIAGGVGAGGAVLPNAELYDATWWTFGPAAPLTTARQSHGAVLLTNGDVLFAGGVGAGGAVLQSAERWSSSGSSSTVSMGNGRHSFAAVLLPSGSVLVLGGFSGTGANAAARNQTELYDPAANGGAGAWSASTNLPASSGGNTGTILPSGRVLVAGGSNNNSFLNGAWVYDPTNVGGFVATADPMPVGREFHTATLLQDGRVLVAGGSSSGPPANRVAPIGTAALYTPGADSWDTTGSLATARTFHTATLLPNGLVLAAGGFNTAKSPLASSELFNPTTGGWSATTGSLAGARYWHTATLLSNGKVLVVGGTAAANPGNPQLPGNGLRTVELFDPATGRWTARAQLVTGRWGHTATLLQSGKVLVVGGASDNSGDSLQTAELYDPAANTWAATAGPPVAARRFHSAVLLRDGRVLLIGGIDAGTPLDSTEVYDPATNTFRATNGTLAVARYRSQGILLQSGHVVMAGGTSGTATALDTAQLYDPAADTWASTSNNMTSVRHGMSFTLLQSGKVLAAGGDTNLDTTTNNPPTATSDLYDEGRTPPAIATPTITNAGSNVPGASITVTGTLFTGISEASGYGTSSSPTNYPLVELTAAGTNSQVYAAVTEYTPTSLTAVLPATALPGPYLLRIVVNGVASAAASMTIYAPLTVTPATVALATGRGQTFTASGGSGSYTWDLATNASGGSITAAGAYTAGSTAGTVDVVRVTDLIWGNTATATVTVGLTILPPAPVSVPPRGTQTFTGSGGRTPYTWSLQTNLSGGSISASGVYTAGSTGNVTDVVQLRDRNGTTTTRNVLVTAGVSISPTVRSLYPLGQQQFTATGGSGAPYTWSISTNRSGGSITGSGAYTAGPTENVADVVTVSDSLGNSASATVTIYVNLAISPTAVTLWPGDKQTFTATGGDGSYTFSLSGTPYGRINASTHEYTAANSTTGDVTDTVQVTSAGRTATATVTIHANLAVSPPTVTLYPGSTQTFTATGGNGSYGWTVLAPAHGNITAGGLYTAVNGGTTDVTDTVQVTSDGHTATATVTVQAQVTISPPTVVVRDGTTQQFTASGGSGLGYTWSIKTPGAGGTIGASSGLYQAPAIAGDDVIQVADSQGHTATAIATVTKLFAAFAFDVTSAGQGATVTATLTVYNDTGASLTVTPPGAAGLTLTALSPVPGAIDPSPVANVASGSSVRFSYPLVVTGAPGASYVASAVAQTSGGPTNLATTPAGTVAEVRVDWMPAAIVASRAGPPYRFSLMVRNDGTFPVTEVQIVNPQPLSFTGLAADDATCSSAAFPMVIPNGEDSLVFAGDLEPGNSTTLCFEFTGVPSVALKTTYPFTVAVTRSGGSPLLVSYGRSVRLDVPPPDVAFPSVLSDATGQTLFWTNTGTTAIPHDGVVVFRTAAPAVPTIPADYVDYRVTSNRTSDLLYGDGSYSTTTSLTDAGAGVFNYRICNHDPDFVYSSCNSGFWNGQGWLDSAVAPAGGWTHQLGGAIYTLPGLVPGATVSVATNLPAAVTLDVATGSPAAELALLAIPSRDTPIAPLGSGRTLLFVADQGGGVTAVDVTPGNLAWQVVETGESFVAGVSGTLRRYAHAAFQASYAGDVLFVGSVSGRLYALDADAGTVLWTLDAGSAIRAPTRYDASNNRLYVGTASGMLAYDLSTSAPGLPPVTAASWVVPGGAYRLACTAGTVATDMACIDDAGVLRVVNRSTGAVKASLATGLASPSTILMAPSPTAGFVVSNAGSVQRVNLAGTTLSSVGQYAPEGVSLSPVQLFSSTQTIYVGGSDGALHKLRLADASDTGQSVSIASEAGVVQVARVVYDVERDVFIFGADDGRLWAVPYF